MGELGTSATVASFCSLLLLAMALRMGSLSRLATALSKGATLTSGGLASTPPIPDTTASMTPPEPSATDEVGPKSAVGRGLEGSMLAAVDGGGLTPPGPWEGRLMSVMGFRELLEKEDLSELSWLWSAVGLAGGRVTIAEEAVIGRGDKDERLSGVVLSEEDSNCSLSDEACWGEICCDGRTPPSKVMDAGNWLVEKSDVVVCVTVSTLSLTPPPKPVVKYV